MQYRDHMDEKAQLEWLQKEQAAVWFGKNSVKIKVKDFLGTIQAATLLDAIGCIEKFRQDRRDVAETLKRREHS